MIEDGTWVFRSFECADEVGEKQAFEGFIDFVQQRRKRYPDLHIYDYASYENGRPEAADR